MPAWMPPTGWRADAVGCCRRVLIYWAAPTTRPEAHNDHARHLFPNKHHEVWPATPTRRLKLKAVAGGEAAHRRLEGAAAMHAFTSQRAA